jgi:L-fuconolactonase
MTDPTPRIDSHQHFWAYSRAEYGWIDDSMSVIARSFVPDDLRPFLDRRSLDGCIAVQARTTETENEYLLDLAARHPFILGVVGWADLESPTLRGQLTALAAHPRFVGVREILQGQPASRFLNDAFVKGLRLVGELDLTYDVLVYAPQLDAVAELLRKARPDQRLVLDHLGKPDIRGRGFNDWSVRVRALAKDHPNVCCKMSGMVTEAATGWTKADLRPYMDTALEAFSPKRLMYGSDWPVCLLNASDYAAVHDVVADWADPLGAEAVSDIFGGTACRFYRVAVPVAQPEEVRIR